MTMLLISSGNGPGECRQAVAHVAARIKAEAETMGFEVDSVERSAKHGPSSVILAISGEAERFAAAWQGVILWRCESTLRPRHKRKNWFVQVFRLAPAAQDIVIDPATVTFSAMRSGGPGGQHQNKTSSAIRACWQSPEGQTYSVAVRDGRSQHANRKTALLRLASLVAQDQAEQRAEAKAETRAFHHQVKRGDAKRVFEGPSFKEVT